MKKREEYRDFLKGDLWRNWDTLNRDEAKGIKPPPVQKEYPENSKTIELISPENFRVGESQLIDAIQKRKSIRKYNDKPLNLEELSFLLWSTQGISIRNNGKYSTISEMRTVPSGGNRHPFETYLYINNVTNITPGLYRYLPLEHKLLFLKTDEQFPNKISNACCKQPFVGKSAVVFIWTAIPYRTEWRYDVIAHKIIAIDAGHLCQNLYLSCTSINAGTCAIGAFYNDEVDSLIGVDGKDEFSVYIAPVGKID